MTWLFGTTNRPGVHNHQKLLPSLHQHRINIDTVKHIHTKPYILVRFNIENFPLAWRNGIWIMPFLHATGKFSMLNRTKMYGFVWTCGIYI